MLKKIFVLISVSLCLFGCTSSKCICENDRECNAQTNISFSAFNDEVYVWENFHFTTNRVQGVR